MQRTVPLFILTVTGKFMPKDLLYQNRVPSTMCHKRIQGRYSMLELDEGKLSRPVLRRGVRGNSDSLADARWRGHRQAALYATVSTAAPCYRRGSCPSTDRERHGGAAAVEPRAGQPGRAPGRATAQ